MRSRTLLSLCLLSLSLMISAQPTMPHDGNKVACKTTKGAIDITVMPQWSPLGAARFLQLVDEGFFNRIALFRCVDNFLCQFGTPLSRPGARTYANIKDDAKVAAPHPFKRGYLSFAGNGDNSRSTDMFITLGENVDSLGKMPWETPFGFVNPESMQKTVSQFNTKYGDIPPWGKGPDPQRIPAPDGASYLNNNFPQLDYILSCKRG